MFPLLFENQEATCLSFHRTELVCLLITGSQLSEDLLLAFSLSYSCHWSPILFLFCFGFFFFYYLFFIYLFVHLFILAGGYLLYNIVVGFVIHCHESAMDLHVFPILNPPPTSPSHPSGSSPCTSPKHLSHASNLVFSFYFPWLVLFLLFALAFLRKG